MNHEIVKGKGEDAPLCAISYIIILYYIILYYIILYYIILYYIILYYIIYDWYMIYIR